MCETSEEAVPHGYLSSRESQVHVAHSPKVVSDRAAHSIANRSEQRPVSVTSEYGYRKEVDIESSSGMPFQITCIRLCRYRQDFLFTSRVRGLNQAVLVVLTVLV